MKIPNKKEVAKDWPSRLREFLSALKNVPWAFRLVWEADSKNAILMGAMTFVGAAVPVSQAWIAKLIIDGVLDSVRAGVPAQEGMRLVLPYVLAEFALILVGSLIGRIRSYINSGVRSRLGHAINLRIIRKALTLEARCFEDPKFYDKMETTRRESDFRTKAVISACFSLATNIMTLASFLVLLFAFSPLIAVCLLGSALPVFAAECRYSWWNFKLETGRATEYRSKRYIEALLTLDTTVKEVKLFSLGEPLIRRYIAIYDKMFREDMNLARRRSIEEFAWGILGSLSYYGAYAWIVYLTLTGHTTLGGMALYLTLFRQSSGSFEGLLGDINCLYENGLFLDNLVEFLALKSSVLVLDQAGRPPEDPSRGIEFQGVWFQYPDREDWAISDLSLTIEPGKKLALVGENGAGKTTLIKLLTRLYEPTRGTILFRGVDIRYFSPEEIHRRVSAIFQDFVRYQVPLSENIGFGAIEHLDDQPRIEAAALKSGADEVARALPESYKTMLGRWFDSGQELSGGQWQKIALGRAFMGDGEVLILDEPTAALDAAAEYDIFQRFKELSNGKMAILVSHRFSTVRMADRIAVLKGGKIEELGSHAELVARGGTYAGLFELQAQGYR